MRWIVPAVGDSRGGRSVAVGAPTRQDKLDGDQLLAGVEG